MAVWLKKYQWVLIIATFAFLAVGFYQTKDSTGRWNRWTLYGTTIISLGLLFYALLFR